MSNQYPYLSPYDPSTDGSQPANPPQVPQPQAGDAQPSLPPLSYQGWEYQGSPYGEAYAASSDADEASQSVPSPTDPSGEGKASKKHTGWWLLLTLVGLLVGMVFYFFGEMFNLVRNGSSGPSSSAPSHLSSPSPRSPSMLVHGAMPS